jgi:hypothetical protein
VIQDPSNRDAVSTQSVACRVDGIGNLSLDPVRKRLSRQVRTVRNVERQDVWITPSVQGSGD